MSTKLGAGIGRIGDALGSPIHTLFRARIATTEPIRPTARRQILLASLLCGEVGLKLTKRLGERWSGHP